MNIRDLSATAAAAARSRFTARQIQAQQRLDRQQPSATYLSYDAGSGLHSLELADGSIVQASSLTTAGIEPGEPVVMGRVIGVPYANFKAMPR